MTTTGGTRWQTLAEQWWVEHSEPVRRIVLAKVGPRYADDATARAMEKIMAKLAAGHVVADPRAYFTRAALNEAVTMCRAETRTELTSELPEVVPPGWADHGANPADEIERSANVDLMRRALDSLGDDDRDVLLARYARGWSVTEIADSGQISAHAVTMRLSRAQDRLADHFAAAHAKHAPKPRCRRVRAKLRRHQRGSLPPRAHDRVSAHLDECGSCAAAYCDIGDAAQSLRALAPWFFVAPVSTGLAVPGEAVSAARGGTWASAKTATVALAGATTVVAAAVATAAVLMPADMRDDAGGGAAGAAAAARTPAPIVVPDDATLAAETPQPIAITPAPDPQPSPDDGDVPAAPGTESSPAAPAHGTARDRQLKTADVSRAIHVQEVSAEVSSLPERQQQDFVELDAPLVEAKDPEVQEPGELPPEFGDPDEQSPPEDDLPISDGNPGVQEPGEEGLPSGIDEFLEEDTAPGVGDPDVPELVEEGPAAGETSTMCRIAVGASGEDLRLVVQAASPDAVLGVSATRGEVTRTGPETWAIDIAADVAGYSYLDFELAILPADALDVTSVVLVRSGGDFDSRDSAWCWWA